MILKPIRLNEFIQMINKSYFINTDSIFHLFTAIFEGLSILNKMSKDIVTLQQ